MQKFIDFIVGLVEAAERAYARKWSFLCFFAALFLGSIAVLGRLDLLPEARATGAVSASPAVSRATSERRTQASPVVSELPTKIEISAIGLSAAVVNPTTTAIDALDRELLSGAVRYPTSALLGETGNVVLFGHSSYLPVVKNQAYKTFNGIQKLVAGDAIIVYASGAAYTYRVQSVAKESANDNTAIPLSTGGKVLTLVTCDSFGKKTDRFVVTADFVESHAISG
ncbi:sortase [Candidatus Kaiserbacteria bacterium]|nr:sortase [Candidatus Kaiserbacteria bacterium]